MVQELEETIDLATANGVVESAYGFTMQLSDVGIMDDVHVTDNAPAGYGVLSLGKLIR